ncbi:hypothetical protein HPB47_011846 [Ixodes persulcatus]|uniref:Uncharacterized protein n=1 Tax=Ixodes persulcatus TaxID=34615 RepID=A0AC60NV80_IXOPE|nr:hypothetical protein HPB47_011846 [Ixodes persulcatus]
MDEPEVEEAANQSSKPSESTEKGKSPSQAEGTKAADVTANDPLTPAATPVGTEKDEQGTSTDAPTPAASSETGGGGPDAGAQVNDGVSIVEQDNREY